MRISSALYFQTGLNSINKQQSKLMHVYQQLGSGNRMLTPADDPLAAAQTLTLGQSQSMNARFAENRHVALRNLGEEENVLMSMIPQVSGAKTRLIEAANGTLSDADRFMLAEVFDEMRNSIANLANAKDANGQYIFSGSKGNVAPFQKNELTDRYEYKGDQTERLVQADQTRQIPSANHGVDLLLRPTPGSALFLTSGDAANTGTGVVGGVTITDPSQATQIASYEINYTEDVSTPPNGQLEITTTNLDGTTATTTVPYAPAEKGGATTVDLGKGVSLQFSGQPQVGDSFSLENAQSKTGDDELNVLNTLADVVAALKTPIDGDPAAKASMQNVINGAMQRLDMSYENILTVRASVGARMNEIDAIESSGKLQGLHLATEISRLEDLDYYSASTQLELRTSALEAAALAFKKIQSTNLFAINARG